LATKSTTFSFAASPAVALKFFRTAFAAHSDVPSTLVGDALDRTRR